MDGAPNMRHFRIKGGPRPQVTDPPVQRILRTIAPGDVALLGEDTPHVRPKYVLSEGAYVAAGQPVFQDRKRPEILYVAPLAGRITKISFGPRRTLSACVITADPDARDQVAGPVPDHKTDGDVRGALLAAGFWPAFRTRPYGLTPAPRERPAAIVVNAVQGSVVMPDPLVVLADQRGAFQTGMSALKFLTDGPLYLSQSPGDPLCPDAEGVEMVAFSGSAAAGLVGSQIDRLCPVRPNRVVWSIGYQDVAAIGHLFETGQFRAERVIAVSGAGVKAPALVRAPLGSALADINEGNSSPVHLQSGGLPHSGRAQFLGRYDDHVIFDPEPKQRTPDGWVSRILNTSDTLVPTSAIETALGLNILPVPLMRALSVGDSEAAQRLGCLALVEEDLATLTQTCTSRADYGVLLRQVLDDLMGDAA